MSVAVVLPVESDALLFLDSSKMTNQAGDIEYKLLTEDKYDEAVTLHRDSMKRECLAIAQNIFEEPEAVREMQSICREVAKDNCSIVAIHVPTDRVVGVCFNKLHTKRSDGETDPFDKFVKETLKHEQSRGLVNFLEYVETQVDIFAKYGVACCMEIFYIGVHDDYGGRGIGMKLVERSIEIAHHLKKPSVRGSDDATLAFGVFTSIYSQRIAKNLHFEWVAAISYDSCTTWDGRPFSERVGPIHKDAKCGVLEFGTLRT